MEKKYRYPGTKSFLLEDESIFFGREEDITNLTTSVVVNATTLLFGKSGTGKSSIIQAGLLPRLQKRNPGNEGGPEPYIVINVLPKPYEKNKDLQKEVSTIVHGQLQTGSDFLPVTDVPVTSTLWYALKHFQYRQLIENKHQALLLVFDQAEELFTYPDSQIDVLVQQLHPVIGQFIPTAFQEIISRQKDMITAEKLKVLYSPLPVKLIFSIRSDKMHLITRLKKASPQILQNSYELLPLNKQNAFDAIDKPSQQEGNFESVPFTITAETKEFIFHELSAQVNDPENNFEEQRIEPFSLQIICSHIEQKILPGDADKIIEKTELEEPQKIINGYYLECIQNLPATEAEKENARNLIELKMISDNRRIPIHEALIAGDEKYPVNKYVLGKLVDARILKKDFSTSGGLIYEITHDCFIKPILDAKADRLGKTTDDKSQETIDELLKKIEDKERGHIIVDPQLTHTNLIELTRIHTSTAEASVPGIASVTENTEVIELYKKLGDAYFVIKDYANAIEWFNKAIDKSDKENTAFLIVTYKIRSDAWFYLNDIEQSSADLKKILSLDPDDYNAMVYLIDNFDRENKLDDAVEFFSEFNITIKNAGVYTEIGNKYFAKKDFINAKINYQKTVDLNPEVDYPYRNLGLVAENMGDKDAAISYYNRYVEINPSSAVIFNDIGNVYYSKQEYTNAQVNYEKALNIDTGFYYAAHNLGLIAESQDNSDEAIRYYSNAIAIKPDFESPNIRLAAIYYKAKDYKKAKDIYDKLIEINPGSVVNYSDRGLIEECLENWNAALDNYSMALQLNPDDETYLFRTAEVRYYKREYEKSGNIYRKLIAIDTSNEKYYYGMGLVEEGLKNQEAAKENYEKVLDLNPVHELALIKIAALHFDRRAYSEAREIYTKLIGINPENVTNYHDIGLIEERLGNLDAAITNYNKALVIKPDYKNALVRIALIYLDEKQYEAAKGIYQKLITLEPDDEQNHYNLGYTEEKLNYIDMALEHYNKAIGLNQHYEKALIAASAIYFYKKDYQKAKDIYIKLVALDADNEQNYYSLALINEGLNEWDNAKKNYEKALTLKPDYKDALVRIAFIYLDEKQYVTAKNIYQKLITLEPDDEQNHYNLGYTEEKLNYLDAALENYNKAIGLNQHYEKALVAASAIYYAKKEYQKAKDIYIKLVDVNAEDEKNYYSLALINEGLNEWDTAKENYEKALTLKPDYKNALVRIALIYLDEKQFEAAKGIYQKLITLEPDDEQNHYNLGYTEEKLNYIDVALEHYKKAIGLNQHYEKALIAVSAIYYDKKEYLKAKDIYIKLVDINAEDEKNYYSLALINEGLNEWDSAKENYEKALTLKPDYKDALVRIALIYLDKKQYEAAKEMYQKLIDLEPDNEQNYYNIGYTEEQLQQADAALENYKKALVLKPDYDLALIGIGAICFDKKEYEQADAAYEKLISLDPKNEGHYYSAGLIKEALQESDNAIALYKKAIGLNAAYKDAWYNLVKIYTEKGDLQTAVSELENALLSSPSVAYIYCLLGSLYDDLWQREKAVTASRKAVELDGTDLNAHRILGYLLSGSGPAFQEEALSLFKYCITKDPEDRYAEASMGACYSRLGNDEQYKIQVEKVAVMTPGPADDEYVLAGTEALCGNAEKAISFLKLALEKKVRSAAYARNDSDFAFISNDPEFIELTA